MAYGQKSSPIMDIPLKLSSVTAGYLDSNNYEFVDVSTVRVLNLANGTLSPYDENNFSTPFGSVKGQVPDEQILTLLYNQSMQLRVQDKQIADIPVNDFARKAALQNIDQVFVPSLDKYALAKIWAGKTNNAIAVDTGVKDQGLGKVIDKVRENGGDRRNMVAWVTYELARKIKQEINYTGSDTGFKAGRAGSLGMFDGVQLVEVPSSYFYAGVSAIVADKRAIIYVRPKMDPKSPSGYKLITKVPGFGGVEIQIRNYTDVFVLNKKANAIASLENSASTTSSTTTTTTTVSVTPGS